MTRCLLLLSAICLCACEAPVEYDPGTPVPAPTAPSAFPASAEIVSVQVFESEVREGMRRVRVRLRLRETPPREVSITEWVPVVLLGRLQPGASVQLVPDPVEDRLTFSL